MAAGLIEILLRLWGVSVLRGLQGPGSICWNRPGLSLCHVHLGSGHLVHQLQGWPVMFRVKRHEERRQEEGGFGLLLDFFWSL